MTRTTAGGDGGKLPEPRRESDRGGRDLSASASLVVRPDGSVRVRVARSIRVGTGCKCSLPPIALPTVVTHPQCAVNGLPPHCVGMSHDTHSVTVAVRIPL